MEKNVNGGPAFRWFSLCRVMSYLLCAFARKNTWVASFDMFFFLSFSWVDSYVLLEVLSVVDSFLITNTDAAYIHVSISVV